MAETAWRKVLVTGGVKSGKSSFALRLALEIAEGGRGYFIATARAIDDEMRAKIESHRRERGDAFTTIEVPLTLADAIENLPSATAVIDCLTLWLSNLFEEAEERERSFEVERFIEALKRYEGNVVIVTNEVGWGIIPADRLSREYGEELGRLNQRVAGICNEVYALLSGQPMRVK